MLLKASHSWQYINAQLKPKSKAPGSLKKNKEKTKSNGEGVSSTLPTRNKSNSPGRLPVISAQNTARESTRNLHNKNLGLGNQTDRIAELKLKSPKRELPLTSLKLPSATNSRNVIQKRVTSKSSPRINFESIFTSKKSKF